MKRRDAVSLGDVLRLAIEESERGRQFDEVTAINSWPLVIGAEISAQSPRPYVRNGVMFVRLRNSALRQELNLRRSSLTAALNKQVGKEIISEIRFIG